MEQEEILRLHQGATVVDAHCDTLSLMRREGSPVKEETGVQVTPGRLRQGGVDLQFFAVFVAPEHYGSYLRRALDQVDAFYAFLARYAAGLAPVYDRVTLAGALATGKVGAVLSLEGGHALEGSIGVLRVLYRTGVRSLTLTWNGRNELADGVMESETGGRLTTFGREVVREMERLGMVIDVAHLAPAGFWDVLDLSSAPV